ncbi:helix-turn-helix transcriptional regulator [Agrobacterium sp. rho-8.1]
MLLKYEEVAEVFSVSNRTLRRWVREGQGFPSPIKVGRAKRFDADELTAYVERRLRQRGGK